LLAYFDSNLHWLSPFNVPHGTPIEYTIMGNVQPHFDK